MNVLICPDKFKGTLTAREAADAIARGWRAGRPQDVLQRLPMSDGGDGFGQVLGEILHAKPQSLETVDAAHRPITALWWWHPPSRTALIESALLIGLAQLPAGQFHPFELDTTSLGTALRAVQDQGARRVLIGIGGSATNDAGFGMARALGWQFLDPAGDPITDWTRLNQLQSIQEPANPTAFEELVVASDVSNPLLGPSGCSRVYGPQKGLRGGDFVVAEQHLGQLARVVAQTLGHDFAREPGAGAAGGLGFGLRCFLKATLRPGFDIFCQQANLPARLGSVDLVITGEGSIDDSTAMGKGVGRLATLCGEHGVPCIGLAGVSSHPKATQALFDEVHSLAPKFTTPENALHHPAAWLEKLATRIATSWRFPPESA